MKDYYRILELSPEATPEMVTQAYRLLAKRYHPDQYHLSDKSLLNDKMAEVNEAYEVLASADRRRLYDRRLSDWQATAPERQKADGRRASRQKLIYWFLLTLFGVMLLKGFFNAVMLVPAVRFVLVGLVIYGWVLWRRQPRETHRP